MATYTEQETQQLGSLLLARDGAEAYLKNLRKLWKSAITRRASTASTYEAKVIAQKARIAHLTHEIETIRYAAEGRTLAERRAAGFGPVCQNTITLKSITTHWRP